MSSGRKQKKGGSIVTALLVMILIFGIGIMLYPTLADWYNRINASQTISGYNKIAERQTKEERERIWKEAQRYNQALSEDTIRNGGTIGAGQEDGYDEELKVEEEGIMGYITIPSIDVNLPIYHGIDEKALQAGAGHLPASSLPVGGESTHCVITGHTGLPSARLFTDLDKLEEGDTFQLKILNQTLTYEIFRIEVVLPTDVDSLRIEEGQDWCTLLTCTPYGINDHRLLVTGKRAETPKEKTVSEQKVGGELRTLLIALLVLLVILAAAGLLIYRHRRKSKNKRERNS